MIDLEDSTIKDALYNARLANQCYLEWVNNFLSIQAFSDYYTITNWCEYSTTDKTEPDDTMEMLNRLHTVTANHPCTVITYMDNETRVFAHYQE